MASACRWGRACGTSKTERQGVRPGGNGFFSSSKIFSAAAKEAGYGQNPLSGTLVTEEYFRERENESIFRKIAQYLVDREGVNWAGEGPFFIKIGGRVVYRLADVEAYELMQIRRSTISAGARPRRLISSGPHPPLAQ